MHNGIAKSLRRACRTAKPPFLVEFARASLSTAKWHRQVAPPQLLDILPGPVQSLMMTHLVTSNAMLNGSIRNLA